MNIKIELSFDELAVTTEALRKETLRQREKVLRAKNAFKRNLLQADYESMDSALVILSSLYWDNFKERK